MDIRHLRYFIAIVENHFNLSKTAQNIYISQPALSMMISEFEEKEGIQLFKRSNGKIVGLTYVGEKYYLDAKGVIKQYNEMYQNLHSEHKDISGQISIGIPPLILSVVFSEVMPKMILANPSIRFITQEQGAFALKSALLLEQVDLAVLLYPEGISKNIIDSFDIHHSELSVFLSPNHPLAQKEKIDWRDLNKQKMAIFDKSFMISHQLKENFERHNLHPNIIIESSSWDFMLNSVKLNPELLTILPYPIAEQYPSTDFVCRKMNDPILWRVTLCRLKKKNYTSVENYVFDSLLEWFNVK